MKLAHTPFSRVACCLLGLASAGAAAQEGGATNAAAPAPHAAGPGSERDARSFAAGHEAAFKAVDDGANSTEAGAPPAAAAASGGEAGQQPSGAAGETTPSPPLAGEGAPALASGAGDVSMSIFPTEVVVRGKRSRVLDLPGSVDVIGDEQLSKGMAANALDHMRQIPGFAYHDYGNGGVPNGFMMRGFASNHGNDTLVVVDGVPINEHGWYGQDDGAPDLNQVTPEEIERLEVIKGSLDARYGNWARSGIIQIQTRQAGDFLRSDVRGGSYGDKKAYVSFGRGDLGGRFSQVYSAEFFQLDGWRENSAQQRLNAYAKWFFKPAEEVRVGLMTHAYKADWSTGSYIAEEAWQRDPRQAFSGAANDGGYKSLTELSLHLDAKVLHRFPLRLKLWHRESTASRYADWTDLGNSQTESHGSEKVTGGTLDVETDWNLAKNQSLRVDFGVDYRDFATEGQNWSTQGRVRQRLNSDNRYVFQNGGLYLKTSYDLARRVRLSGAIREDLFYGKSVDHLAGTKSPMKTYSVPTYKGGIVGSVLKDYSLYGNIGTTFRLPNKDTKYLQEPPPVAALLFWEMGLKARPLDSLMLRYAYFQSTERATLFVQGQYVDDGKARRAGHEVELSAGPWHGAELFTAVTVHDARYLGGANDGKWVPTVPRFIWKVGVQAETPWGTGGRVNLSDVGMWNTDSANEHSYVGYRFVDLTVSQVLMKGWSAALDVKNLLNAKYAEFVGFWSGSNQYMPSNPRTVFLSLRYNTL
jgi:iron complex outermembrane receptor protein